MLLSAGIAATALALFSTTFAASVEQTDTQVVITNKCSYDVYLTITPGKNPTYPGESDSDSAGKVPITKNGGQWSGPYISTDDECTNSQWGDSCPAVGFKISRSKESVWGANDILHFEYHIHESMLWYDISLTDCAPNNKNDKATGFNIPRCPGYEGGWKAYYEAKSVPQGQSPGCQTFQCPDPVNNFDQCKWNAFMWADPLGMGMQSGNPVTECSLANAYQYGNLHFELCSGQGSMKREIAFNA